MTSAATIGKAADDGSAGTTTGRGVELGAAGQGDPPALALRLDRDFGAEMDEHFLGVVARGFAFDDGGAAARVQARKQHRRFDLRRGDRRAVEDRRRIEGAAQRDRAAPALRLLDHLRAHQQQRIEHAPHRPLAQRRVAVEGGEDSVAADHAHHQPRAGAGVAEVERSARRENRADAQAADAPAPLADPLDAGAERAAGLAGAQHVVAFEQALDRRFRRG